MFENGGKYSAAPGGLCYCFGPLLVFLANGLVHLQTQGSRPGLASRCIRTCYGTPAAMPWSTGARHQGAAGLSRTQKYPAYGALHRAISVAVQGFLADLSFPMHDSCSLQRSKQPQCPVLVVTAETHFIITVSYNRPKLRRRRLSHRKGGKIDDVVVCTVAALLFGAGHCI